MGWGEGGHFCCTGLGWQFSMGEWIGIVSVIFCSVVVYLCHSVYVYRAVNDGRRYERP